MNLRTIKASRLIDNDVIVTGSGADLCYDIIRRIYKPEPSCAGPAIIRIDAMRTWPNDATRIQGRNVFFWVGVDSEQAVL